MRYHFKQCIQLVLEVQSLYQRIHGININAPHGIAQTKAKLELKA